MTRKQWILAVLAVLLGAFSLYLNRDWFARVPIQISHRSMPPRPRFNNQRRAADADINPVLFLFNRQVKLTALKVIAVSDAQTNKYPHALWHLISDSNSIPVKEFFYGANLRGMKPAIKGIVPEPLQPGISYRLVAQVGSETAEHDFEPVQRVH